MLEGIGLKSVNEVAVSESIQTPPVIPLHVCYLPEAGDLQIGFKVHEALHVPDGECGRDEIRRMYVISSLDAARSRVVNVLYGYAIDQIRKSLERLQVGFSSCSGEELKKAVDSLTALMADLETSVVLVEACGKGAEDDVHKSDK